MTFLHLKIYNFTKNQNYDIIFLKIEYASIFVFQFYTPYSDTVLLKGQYFFTQILKKPLNKAKKQRLNCE